MKKHIRSIEQLSHFRCGSCSGWWSIGDAPRRLRWFCPWCGVAGIFKMDQPNQRAAKHVPVEK